jgi:inward rectifier potassium channel
LKNPFKSGQQSSLSQEPADLGLGGKYRSGMQRVLRKDGSFNIRRLGVVRPLFDRLIQLPWWQFFLYTALIYIAINLLFGSAYFILGVEAINVTEYPANSLEAFLAAFHCSAQTLTTVGYGFYHPVSGISAFIATFEAFIGLLSFAFATGLLYGRFSRPRSGIVFSEKALLVDQKEEGRRALMLRIANKHSSSMIEVRARLIFTWMGEGRNGQVRN